MIYLEYILKPKIHSYRTTLEDSGDQLPTFVNTYQDYVDELERHLDGVQSYINLIRTIQVVENLEDFLKLKITFQKIFLP